MGTLDMDECIDIPSFGAQSRYGICKERSNHPPKKLRSFGHSFLHSERGFKHCMLLDQNHVQSITIRYGLCLTGDENLVQQCFSY